MKEKYWVHSFNRNEFEVSGPYATKDEARAAYEREVVRESYLPPADWSVAFPIEASSLDEAMDIAGADMELLQAQFEKKYATSQ
jgi:hypothetical protein